MTQGIFWRISQRSQTQKILGNLAKWIEENWDFEDSLVLQPKPYKNPRSLSQNALFHMWCGEMAQQMADRGVKVEDEAITADDVKLMMKIKYLGTEDIVRGKLVVKDQLRRTSTLDKGEMFHFMEQVEEWATDRGCQLTIPAQSDYMKYREAQSA